eukprot:2367256-Rhodomonas_salina.1
MCTHIISISDNIGGGISDNNGGGISDNNGGGPQIDYQSPQIAPSYMGLPQGVEVPLEDLYGDALAPSTDLAQRYRSLRNNQVQPAPHDTADHASATKTTMAARALICTGVPEMFLFVVLNGAHVQAMATHVREKHQLLIDNNVDFPNPWLADGPVIVDGGRRVATPEARLLSEEDEEEVWSYAPSGTDAAYGAGTDVVYGATR